MCNDTFCMLGAKSIASNDVMDEIGFLPLAHCLLYSTHGTCIGRTYMYENITNGIEILQKYDHNVVVGLWR